MDKKNIDIISSNLFKLHKTKEDNYSNFLKYIKIFEDISYFKTFELKSKELLFDEWNINNCFYIIKKWSISIEKYTTIQKKDTMKLAILKDWDFLWEWSFQNRENKKEVIAKALENTILLKLEWLDNINNFLYNYKELWIEFLKIIIDVSNVRLLESNKIITMNFEIEKTINSLKEINYKWFFYILNEIKNIIWLDYVLYFEKNTILSDFLTLKYDSRKENKIQDLIFEKKWYFIDLDELFERCTIKNEDKIIINKLSLWWEVYWFLIFWRYEKNFNSTEKKQFWSLSNSMSWLLKKFISDKEDKNKNYIKEMNIY